MEIRKVLERKDGVKMAIVPKESDIIKGDLIYMLKVDEEEIKDKIKKEVIKDDRRKEKSE